MKKQENKDKNYIIKSFNNKKKKPDFYFLRWLAEINKNEKETNYVCQIIAKYMASKSYTLPLLDVFVVDDTVFIYTQYPGKWIGEKASNIEDLQHLLNYKANGEMVHNFKINIVKPVKTNFNNVMSFLRGYKKKG